MKGDERRRNPEWEGRQPLNHPPLTESEKAAVLAAYERVTGRKVWKTMVA